jgi:hypothetical protein
MLHLSFDTEDIGSHILARTKDYGRKAINI